MICPLISVETFYIISSNIAGPLDIKIVIFTFHHIETGILACIDHSVVYMSSVGNFEGHKQCLERITSVSLDSIRSPVKLHIAWIWEESRWWSVRVYRFEEVDLLSVRLEDTVGETCLLSLYEEQV